MLVLMRKAGESIYIGDDIVVTLLGFDRHRAKLSILADRSIPIDSHRSSNPGKQHGDGRGHLVLVRHEQEPIWIGRDITVTVVAIERGKVRIGVDAPAQFRIDRDEIHERRKREALFDPCDANERAAPPRKIPIRIKRSRLREALER